MAMSDPLGDMLTRIRNGQMASKSAIKAPASKLRANVLEVLRREGYIRGFADRAVREGVRETVVDLRYHEGQPAIREIVAGTDAAGGDLAQHELAGAAFGSEVHGRRRAVITMDQPVPVK